MPLTTALYTGMSGLNANQTALDVIGNNIANVNTTAFKGSRALFQPEYSETYSFGTPPGGTFGGSNPSQKGLGVRVGKIQRNFASGNIKLTGMKTDMAIDGDGMFVLDGGERYFSRSGHFELNADSYLVSPEGLYVMGYGVDQNYNILEGSLDRLRIPTNKVTIARATSNVTLEGQLGGASTEVKVATQGTVLESNALTDSTAAGGTVANTSLLTDLREDGNLAPIFEIGTTLNFEGMRGASRLQGPRKLDITATTTVEELQDFMVSAFGVNTDPTLTPAGCRPAGHDIKNNSNGTWSLEIVGNIGEENAIQIGTGGLTVTVTGNPTQAATVPGPLTFGSSQEANGTSVFSSYEAYDSLGNKAMVDLTFVLLSQDNSGREWGFYANSLDDTDVSTVLGSGTINFDPKGDYLASSGTTLTIDRDSTGVLSPLQVKMELSGISGVLREGKRPRVQLSSQDGEAAGTLTNFSVSGDGTITGSFSNGSTRELGRLAVATVPNYAGLIDAGESMFKAGPNSGEAIIAAPMTNGAGKIVAGAIETSNVDISREFIDLIVASTGFSAASRIITTSNQLLTELLSIVR